MAVAPHSMQQASHFPVASRRCDAGLIQTSRRHCVHGNNLEPSKCASWASTPMMRSFPSGFLGFSGFPAFGLMRFLSILAPARLSPVDPVRLAARPGEVLCHVLRLTLGVKTRKTGVRAPREGYPSRTRRSSSGRKQCANAVSRRMRPARTNSARDCSMVIMPSARPMVSWLRSW